MALGKILQDARLRKKMTTSQVAAATRMKIQNVESLEREDFSHITAPVYGKGFLRLYAECVGLDPKPLIDEYMEKHAPRKKPSLVSEGPPPSRITDEPVFGTDEIQPEPAKAQAKVQDVQPDLFTSVPEVTELAVPMAGLPPKSGEEKRPQVELWDKPVESAAERMWEPESTISSPISGGSNPFENRQTISLIKHVSMIIGAIVILIFLVSGISRWTKKPASQESSATQHAPQKLRVAVPPPAPYVD